MKPLLRRPLLSLLPLAALCSGAALVEACGPDWVQLLPSRAQVLREPIPLVLAEELRALALPSTLDEATRRALAADAPLQVHEPFDPDETPARWLKAQQQDLSPADAQRFATARQAASGELAARTAAPLPPAWRLYATAAAELRAGQVELVRQHLEQLLKLPADDARPMAVWAAYSLGRLLRDSEPEAAAQAFVAARRWRAGGAPDPLGLALDSLGEQARLGVPVADDGRRDFDALDDAAWLAALRLYVEQARLGSQSGVDSLRRLQPGMVAPARVALLMSQDWGQAVLVRLLADRDPGVDDAQALQRYRQVIAALPAGQRLAEPERWAALAWQLGDIERAQAWAGADPRTALGAWTRAKLALAAGDSARAAQGFATAVQAWPQGADGSALRRLRAEQGLLQLQRGELPLGLRTLLAAGDSYALDAAFVAERLLTTDELRAVVDDTAPAAAQPMRHLLARRLMRDGRFADALPYFPTQLERLRYTDDGEQVDVLDVAALARAYTDALQRADRAWTRVGRAGELMAAGHVAREHGLLLMGFELGPDGAASDGGFDMLGGDPQDPAPAEVRRLAQRPATLPLPAGSAADELPRFHYRYVAAQHALQAAELLPARSQAFASSLCHAAWWVGVRDPGFGAAMWDQYRREGARVDWAPQFGRHCPEPDLSGARRLQWTNDVHHALPWLQRHPLRSAAGAGLLVLALGGAAWAWRRRR